MVALEGGTYTISTSSGQAAQFVAISTICSVGNNIISTSCLYGGTYIQLKLFFFKRIGYNFKIGINFKFVQDFEAICKITHDTGIPVIVDNTFGGYLIKLIEHGADILLFIVGATKWIEGHGTTIGGVVSMEVNFRGTMEDY
ncbi:hypothetical protein GLOIN_2v1675844 [Rhizophagus irregularis DAOM 181602=DAOM 197198]|uniref:PLP-dependent transferase n=1 Tax=Rhizophagus irregularis (strain DAOM 181602 / DAOM 197198 / MUCL 43194) TaxID=747089 RepID=A0A2P4PGA4_RHIID|nr:hypothetical protein GLOIN_2v1675844 [Rhizophagus irregularis DAOM 181602=DAOM 197198]POG64412.1 hypothetical protein GLOIN_2v1675844 [Rhizophagus irregularis DAOM 181602=DAOM 197198]|eukprot:XP_025171278.1 hypothetical protein GLOIN_2v1675844 [Rhizophagus irregularis DAOM 181602=DAOM 197198]